MSDYKILGLTAGATPEEAKLAYRRLVKEHHPDRAKDAAAATKILSQVNAAYDRIKAGKPDYGKDVPKDSHFFYRGFSKPAAQPHQKPSTGPRRQSQEAKQSTARGQEQSSWASQSTAGTGKSQWFKSDPKYSQSANKAGPSGAASGNSDSQRQSHRHNFDEKKARDEARAREERTREEAQAREARAREEMRQAAARAAAERRAAQERASRAQSQSESEARVIEMKMSGTQRKAITDALNHRMRQEAYRRVTELRGIYPDPRKPIDTNRGDLPGFHAAEDVTFKGRTMQIHLGSEAKEGRNIIAIPEVSVSGGRTLHPGNGAALFEVSGVKGSGSMQVDAKSNPLKETGLEVEVIFGSQRIKDRKASAQTR